MRFRQTLTLGERHLVGRLESFGDIVVGFSMSQLALQLEIPKTPQDVFAHSLRYIIFFLAFGIVSIFWFRFHRIMATGFAPRRLDVTLLFAFLAFVALVPYALVTYTRLHSGDEFSSAVVTLYLAVFLGVIGFSWVLAVRGMRRAWGHLDETERRETWRVVVAGAVAIPIFVAALAAVAVFGVSDGTEFLLLFVLIPVAVRVARRPWAWAVGPDADTPAGTLGTVEVS